MTTQKQKAKIIADLLVKWGVDYDQTKPVFKMARQIAGLEPTKKKRGAVERLTLEEQFAFLEAAYAKTGRTGIMMQTLLETGARVSEFVDMEVTDISFAERIVRIRRGKGEKAREVPIRKELANILSVHIGDRKRGALFQSRQKSNQYKYTRQRVWQIVKDVARGAGIEKRVYTHLLRHTMATYLLNNGMSLDEVGQFLGHEDTNTTKIYAVMNSATLRRKLDLVTSGRGREMVQRIEKVHGQEGASAAVRLLSAVG